MLESSHREPLPKVLAFCEGTVPPSVFGRHNAYHVGRQTVHHPETRLKGDSILDVDLPAPDVLLGLQWAIFASFVLTLERLGLEPLLLPV